MGSSDKDRRPFFKTGAGFVAAALLVGGIITAMLLLFSKDGAYVRVSVDGRETELLPLDRDTEYEIKGAEGGVNLLVIKDHRACIRSADCPDGLCVKMGEISKTGQSIICLPNRVVVEVVEGP